MHPVSDLRSLLSLEPVKPDAYLGAGPILGWGRIYGGQVVAQASTDQEEILLAECDPARIEEVRRNWPFLRDRRVDAYQSIVKRWDR